MWCDDHLRNKKTRNPFVHSTFRRESNKQRWWIFTKTLQNHGALGLPAERWNKSSKKHFKPDFQKFPPTHKPRDFFVVQVIILGHPASFEGKMGRWNPPAIKSEESGSRIKHRTRNQPQKSINGMKNQEEEKELIWHATLNIQKNYPLLLLPLF